MRPFRTLAAGLLIPSMAFAGSYEQAPRHRRSAGI